MQKANNTKIMMSLISNKLIKHNILGSIDYIYDLNQNESNNA